MIKLYNFTIEEDRNGFILTEEKITKTGKDIGKIYYDITYPSTLVNCLNKMKHRLPKKAASLAGYIGNIERINREFKEIIANLNSRG